MIIDIHAHTSAHRLWGLHTPSADLAELRFYAEEYKIGKIILMATYFPFKGTGLSNLVLQARINGDQLFGFFGSLDLSVAQPEFQELEELAAVGAICGLKIYPGYQEFHLDDQSKMAVLCGIAQKYALPIALHLGELHHCCPKDRRAAGQGRCGRAVCPLDRLGLLAHPYQLGPLAGSYPDVKFIACHLANPYFPELRQVMINHPNIFTDISGQFVSGSEEDTEVYRRFVVEEILQFLDLPNGIERIMFATDFPIQSYRDSLDLIERLGLSAVEREKVLGGNASELLKIS
ncbi:MAG: amidohydrolase family protein [Patescibacteria group bacterium]